MTTEWMIRLAQCVVLVLVQVLFLNHIHLFGLAIPLLYIYIAITFRRGTPSGQPCLPVFYLAWLSIPFQVHQVWQLVR